jgi:hypothetical protein
VKERELAWINISKTAMVGTALSVDEQHQCQRLTGLRMRDKDAHWMMKLTIVLITNLVNQITKARMYEYTRSLRQVA